MKKAKGAYTFYYIIRGQHAFKTCYSNKKIGDIIPIFHNHMQNNLDILPSEYELTRIERGKFDQKITYGLDEEAPILKTPTAEPNKTTTLKFT